MEIGLIISCFIIPYFLFFKKIRTFIGNIIKHNFLYLFIGLVLLSIYPLIFDIVKFDLNSIDIFFRIIYILVPFLALQLKDRRITQNKYKRIIDLFVFIILWIPVELDFLPGGKLKYTGNITIQTTLLGIIPAGLYLYLIVSPIADKFFNFTFSLTRKDIFTVVLSYIIILLIIIPIGLYIDFLQVKTQFDFFLFIFLEIITFFIFITIPEEFLFRIVFINAIRQNKEFNRTALIIISSIIFGSAHLANATPRWDSPNWAYFSFSSIAGAFYAYTYLKTNKFLPPVLLHTLVNVTWFFFFK